MSKGVFSFESFVFAVAVSVTATVLFETVIRPRLALSTNSSNGA
jgi:hypothetical protein